MNPINISGNITCAFFCDQSLYLIPGMCFVGDIEVFANHKSLQQLNLSYCYGISGEFLERAVSTSRLRELSLKFQ